MITDINGVEINVGDEVYCSLSNKIYKIKIVKEMPGTIHYLWQHKVDSKYSNKKAGDWSNKTYMYKSSNSFKNMLKI